MPNLNRTFKELQDAIKDEMQLDPGLISDRERKQFLNEALKDLGSMGLFEKTEELDIEFGYADLPNDFVELISVKYGVRELKPMPDSNYGISENPIGYTLFYDRIATVPLIANGIMTLYYSYRPKTLVMDTDKPDIPNGYDKLLVDWAVGHAHRKNGNIALYREYLAAYSETKTALMTELTKRLNSRISNIHNTDSIQYPTFLDFL